MNYIDMVLDPETSELKAKYVGLTLSDIPTPSAILDLGKLRVNCQRMLDATDRLSLSWRCHIKTHKVGSS